MAGLAILCSGQGAQNAGMFDLLAEAPQAAPVFGAARAALDGRDPRALVRRPDGVDLHANRVGQVLCCTQALAAWAVLRDIVAGPLVVAGYSVGELAAWGVAGLLDVATVLRLAVRRAAVMDADTDEPSGLVAIRGLARARLEPLCRARHCHVAIVNAFDQMLVGGTTLCLQALVADADAHGGQATMLPVAVASHTPMLERASRRFREALADAPVAAEIPSGIRLLSGIDGSAVLDPALGLDKLALQVSHTIDWAACMDACRSAGVSRVLELGPGGALARLIRSVLGEGGVHSVSEFRSVAGLQRWLSAAGP